MAQTPDDFAAQFRTAAEKAIVATSRLGIAFEAAGGISAEVTAEALEIMKYARTMRLDADLTVSGALRRIQADIELIRLLRAEAAK